MGQSESPRLNPLNIPWGKKPKKEKEDPVPSFIGVRNEAVRDSSDAKQTIHIKVRGLRGAPDGDFELEWTPGTPLKTYLSRLKLLMVAAHSAIRDTERLELGRLRLHYIPEPGAKIVLGRPTVSSAISFQRSNHNAESVAQRMGGGSRYVDIPLWRK